MTTDNTLAPRTWDSYIGQEKIKKRLQVQIQGALSRMEPLKHTLILGQAGTGKTTLAELIAGEMQTNLLSVMMTPGFNMKLFNKKLLEFEGGIVFCDEIHILSKKDQHYLLSIMEEGMVAMDGMKKQAIEAPFTIVAATTDQDKLIKPLYGRFQVKHHLDDYSDLEMAKIVERMCHRIGVEPEPEFCLAMGRASAGTPRQARGLVFTAQDLQTFNPEEILEHAGLTRDGLTEDHVAYLKTIDALGGHNIGLKAISNHSHRPQSIIEDLEKLLVDKRYIELGSSGRNLLNEGLKALKTINEKED